MGKRFELGHYWLGSHVTFREAGLLAVLEAVTAMAPVLGATPHGIRGLLLGVASRGASLEAAEALSDLYSMGPILRLVLGDQCLPTGAHNFALDLFDQPL